MLSLAERRKKAFDPRPREFMRAAFARLALAEYLVDPPEPKEMPIAPKFYLEAIYLGGYAVECALTAMISERTAESKRLEKYKTIGAGAINTGWSTWNSRSPSCLNSEPYRWDQRILFTLHFALSGAASPPVRCTGVSCLGFFLARFSSPPSAGSAARWTNRWARRPRISPR